MAEWKGTEDNPIEVSADDILNAIAEGEDIKVQYAVIKGDLDVEKIANRLERDEYGRFFIQRNVSFSLSEITGDVNFSNIIFSKDAHFDKTTFNGYANFVNTFFSGVAAFGYATFSSNTDFGEAIFNKDAGFGDTTFEGVVYFIQAVFCERAFFGNHTTFGGGAFFINTTFITGDIDFKNATFFGKTVTFLYASFQLPAIFRDVKYWSDSPRVTLARWLWKDGIWGNFLRRFLLLPKNSPRGKPQESAEFYLDSQNIDEVSNPHFKRYVADQQYIRALKDNHPIIYQLWRKTSNCGRSLSMWATWSLIIAILFGLAYAHKEPIIFGVTGGKLLSGLSGLLGAVVATACAIRKKWLGLVISLLVAIFFGLLCTHIIVVTDNLQPNFKISDTKQNDSTDVQEKSIRKPTWFTYIYFSVVTFTTLGFGDVTPLNTAGEVLLTIEVILGYVMLGGLISIFANKLARRS